MAPGLFSGGCPPKPPVASLVSEKVALRAPLTTTMKRFRHHLLTSATLHFTRSATGEAVFFSLLSGRRKWSGCWAGLDDLLRRACSRRRRISSLWYLGTRTSYPRSTEAGATTSDKNGIETSFFGSSGFSGRRYGSPTHSRVFLTHRCVKE